MANMNCECGCNGANLDRRLITTTDAIRLMWSRQNLGTTTALTVAIALLTCLALLAYTYGVWCVAAKVTASRIGRMESPKPGDNEANLDLATVSSDQGHNGGKGTTISGPAADNLTKSLNGTNSSDITQTSDIGADSEHIYDEVVEQEEGHDDDEEAVIMFNRNGAVDNDDGIQFCRCAKLHRRPCHCIKN